MCKPILLSHLHSPSYVIYVSCVRSSFGSAAEQVWAKSKYWRPKRVLKRFVWVFTTGRGVKKKDNGCRRPLNQSFCAISENVNPSFLAFGGVLVVTGKHASSAMTLCECGQVQTSTSSVIWACHDFAQNVKHGHDHDQTHSTQTLSSSAGLQYFPQETSAGLCGHYRKCTKKQWKANSFAVEDICLTSWSLIQNSIHWVPGKSKNKSCTQPTY